MRSANPQDARKTQQSLLNGEHFVSLSCRKYAEALLKIEARMKS